MLTPQVLEQVQTVLTSGLVGAIVTAPVAIMGAVASARTSRAEWDLKRLDVVEKVVALKKAGVGVPRDIAEDYQGRSSRRLRELEPSCWLAWPSRCSSPTSWAPSAAPSPTSRARR